MFCPMLNYAHARLVLRATVPALAVLVVTTVHHVYGAALFETPWRLHVAYVSVPIALLVVVCARLGRIARESRIRCTASVLYFLLTGFFAVALIGVYEGGFNHLLPNLQYILGYEGLREGLYEPPDNLLFQITGIAQFAIALLAGVRLWQLLRVLRRAALPPESRQAIDP
jgi:hypothetical protein